MEQFGDVTAILNRLSGGDGEAIEELLPLVYDELRTIADRYMRRERVDHTLQATALTHEAYLRLVGQNPVTFENRAHFLGVAAQAMRRILVDHARTKRRVKRGGQQERVSLDKAPPLIPEDQLDFIALDEALKELSKEDERKGKVVELLYFGGLTATEAAEVLGVNSRTVERDWRYSRVWLLRTMSQGEEHQSDVPPASR